MVTLKEYPEESDLVVCTVREVKNFGAFVTLNEYSGKEGFIHITEVASGWVKYIRDYLKEGQVQVCKVLRVNPSKGHIDLSFKQVNEHQHRMKIQEWKNSQKSEKLIEMVAKQIGKSVEQCYKDFANAEFQTVNWAGIIAVATGVAAGHFLPGVVPLNAVLGGAISYLVLNPLLNKKALKSQAA